MEPVTDSRLQKTDGAMPAVGSLENRIGNYRICLHFMCHRVSIGYKKPNEEGHAVEIGNFWLVIPYNIYR